MTALVPPFTRGTAIAKVRMAEDGWNSRDPHRVSLAYQEPRMVEQGRQPPRLLF
jgi:nuclear transport factor 2 (NTF2) superfamily protein